MGTFYLTTLVISALDLNVTMRGYTYGWGSSQIEDPEKSVFDVLISTILKEMEIEVVDPQVCENALGRNIKYDEMCIRAVEEGGTSGTVINFYESCLTSIAFLRVSSRS